MSGVPRGMKRYGRTSSSDFSNSLPKVSRVSNKKSSSDSESISDDKNTTLFQSMKKAATSISTILTPPTSKPSSESIKKKVEAANPPIRVESGPNVINIYT